MNRYLHGRMDTLRFGLHCPNKCQCSHTRKVEINLLNVSKRICSPPDIDVCLLSRSCTNASAAFVSAVENGGAKGPTLCSTLSDALEAHAALLNSVTMGEGIDNHLLSLKEAARERELGEGDELWSLPTYIRAQNWNLSTTCVQSQPYLAHFSASGSELSRGGTSCSYSLQVCSWLSAMTIPYCFVAFTIILTRVCVSNHRMIG